MNMSFSFLLLFPFVVSQLRCSRGPRVRYSYSASKRINLVPPPFRGLLVISGLYPAPPPLGLQPARLS